MCGQTRKLGVMVLGMQGCAMKGRRSIMGQTLLKSPSQKKQTSILAKD
jgi:hypothetical protein